MDWEACPCHDNVGCLKRKVGMFVPSAPNFFCGLYQNIWIIILIYIFMAQIVINLWSTAQQIFPFESKVVMLAVFFWSNQHFLTLDGHGYIQCTISIPRFILLCLYKDHQRLKP